MRWSFKQREGLEELPRALNENEFPKALRNAIWNLIYGCIFPHGSNSYISDLWRNILTIRYRDFYCERMDRFDIQREYENMAHFYSNKNHIEILNDLDFMISIDTWQLDKFREKLKNILDDHQCYYNIFFEGKDSVIVQRGTEQEKKTIEKCYKDLKENNKFSGAKTHLINAVKFLNDNNFSGSVRESISAVESVCKVITNKEGDTLTGALQKIANTGYINTKLKEGFKNLYTYTSDEKGIRHALSKGEKAKVDSVDAQYMIGSCASFVSYLINKANNNGLLK